MNIESKKVVIELTGHECYLIACDLKHSLKYSIETHYCGFDDRVFNEQESDKIWMIFEFYSASSYRTTVEEIKKELLDFLHEKQEELEAKKSK